MLIDSIAIKGILFIKELVLLYFGDLLNNIFENYF
jgi:hypothetical protein